MKLDSVKRKAVIITVALLCAGLCGGALYYLGVPEFIVCLVFSAAIILLMLLLLRVSTSSQEKLVLELSELLEQLSSESFTPVFPEYDDTLLSKLQSQLMWVVRTLNAQRDENERDKNDIKSLISDISHQLKTPVASLKLYGDLMLDSSLEENERREYSQAFSVSLEKLIFLTDSLIKMSRLESGIISLDIKSSPLEDTVLAAVMQARDKALAADTVIEFDPACVKGISVIHDTRWSAEALFNIIDNAIKYGAGDGSSPESLVRITVTKYEMYARVDISDNGEGIPEADINRIFARFVRGTNAAEKEGAGIGLYLSREIITAQGGYIKVKSVQGNTVFSVFFRL